jgi:hypothetical protein
MRWAGPDRDRQIRTACVVWRQAKLWNLTSRNHIAACILDSLKRDSFREGAGMMQE